MRIFRTRRCPRWLLLVLIILFLSCCYPLFQLFNLTIFGDSNALPTNPICDVGPGFRNKLLIITSHVHHVLKIQKVRHFLCLGSLWAALRRQSPFPWDRKVTFCIRNEDLADIDEVNFKREFEKRGLGFSYKNSDGTYTINSIEKSSMNTGKSEEQPKVILYVFEEKTQDGKSMMARVGWKYRILGPGSESLLEFPPDLIAKSLPNTKFGNLELPAPHEGVELQKYHYVNDWWKEIKPDGCNN